MQKVVPIQKHRKDKPLQKYFISFNFDTYRISSNKRPWRLYKGDLFEDGVKKRGHLFQSKRN